MAPATFEQVNVIVDEIIGEFPAGHKNDVCEYFEDGVPICVVGQLLFRLGYEHAPDHGQLFDDPDTWRPIFAPDALNFLGNVQLFADRLVPWVEAVERVRAGDDPQYA